MKWVTQALAETVAVERIEELRMIRDKWQPQFKSLLDETSVLIWNDYVNEWHDTLISQTLRCCEQHLQQMGLGPPPARYAFVLFGSGGRREQSLWSDQDHGLIIGNTDIPEHESYFAALSMRIVQMLQVIGFPPCKGQVLCSNALWRKSLAGWEAQFERWSGNLTWENVRYLLIALDMRCVYGDVELASCWRHTLIERLRRTSGVRDAMVRNTLYYKASLNIFGQLVRERFGEFAGGINLKYGAYIPLVNGIRFLSVMTNLEDDESDDSTGNDSSTWNRLQRLCLKESVPTALLEQCELVFPSVMALRASIPYQMHNGLYANDGFLAEGQITKPVARTLKRDLQAVVALQRYVGKQMKTNMRQGS